MNLFTKTLATTAVLALAGTAMATADFGAVTSGPWNDPATWGHTGPAVEGSTIPGSGNTVEIGSIYDVNVSAAGADALAIDLQGSLTIDDGADLTLSMDKDVNSNFVGTLIVDGGSLVLNSVDLGHLDISSTGTLVMQGSAPVVFLNAEKVLRVVAAGTGPRISILTNAMFDTASSGSFEGQADAAIIAVNDIPESEDAVTFTLDVGAKMQGRFTINRGQAIGDATFYNKGRVSADVSGGKITLGSNLLLDDDNGDDNAYYWEALQPSGRATLQFEGNATNLAGDFNVTGEVRLQNVNVTTAGKAYLPSSPIARVSFSNSGKTFTYSGGKLSGSATCPFGATSVTSTSSPQNFDAGDACP